MRFIVFICLAILPQLVSSQQLKTPSFEEVISLNSAANPKISPSGKHIVFEVRSTDWQNNRFDTELWLVDSQQEVFQLTNNENNSSNGAEWSPDGKWIAYLTDKGNKRQVYALRTIGGAAYQVTHSKQGVGKFEWSPDGVQILYTEQEDKSDNQEKEEEKYGSFATEDKDYTNSKLWLLDFDPNTFSRSRLPGDSTTDEASLLIEDFSQHVRDFSWSPDGKNIAIEHSPTSALLDFLASDISVYSLSENKLSLFVSNSSSDGFITWSPDSKSILYTSVVDDTSSSFYANDRYFVKNLDGNHERELATNFDENLGSFQWIPSGILATARQKTRSMLFTIDPANGDVNELLSTPERIYSLSVTSPGTKLAFVGNTSKNLEEIYTASADGSDVVQITSFNDQITGWKVSNSEVINWKSEDGTVIEGVLHKPRDYDPNKKYPLLIAIHGGPTGISLPAPVVSYVYPVLQWLDKGALVLMPNYRGSAGYGEAFRSLNVKNLGVGDAWDVMSGVAYLDGEGLIDTNKIGAMGWSQGGYISAFLTTHTDQFKAISVGAGISDWKTYYVSTDIHPFTRQYLKATPWEDPEVYVKTSPMTKINNASTPTLIQHGEFDRRVPISNAYELYQGLQDVGVDTKLIVYKGFGHGITKPKERLAAIWHNWQWFGKYIWDEDITIPID